ADDGARRGCLARLHAGARQRHDRNPPGLELRFEVEPAQADPRGHADALAEIREVQGHTEHTTVEWLALVRIDGVADPEHAADVEHLDDIARLHGGGNVARVAEERLAVAESAHHDVALAHLGHAAAGELE